MLESMIVPSICTIIGSVISSLVTFLFTKKKYNAEVDSAKIDNLKQIIDIQNEQIKNLSERLNIILDRNKQLEQEVVEVRKQMFNVLSSICYDFTCKHRQQNEQKTTLKDKK